MSDRDEVLARLGEAQITAQAAVAALSAQRSAEPDPEKKEAIRLKLVAANSLYQKATNALQREIFNPADSALASLEDATAELDRRIEQFKQDSERLEDLAAGLNLLSSAISFILLL